MPQRKIVFWLCPLSRKSLPANMATGLDLLQHLYVFLQRRKCICTNYTIDLPQVKVVFWLCHLWRKGLPANMTKCIDLLQHLSVFVQCRKCICTNYQRYLPEKELTDLSMAKCLNLMQHLSVGRDVFGNIIETHLARSEKYIFIIWQIHFTKKEKYILNSVVTPHSLEKELASKHGQVLASPSLDLWLHLSWGSHTHIQGFTFRQVVRAIFSRTFHSLPFILSA